MVAEIEVRHASRHQRRQEPRYRHAPPFEHVMNAWPRIAGSEVVDENPHLHPSRAGVTKRLDERGAYPICFEDVASEGDRPPSGSNRSQHGGVCFVPVHQPVEMVPKYQRARGYSPDNARQFDQARAFGAQLALQLCRRAGCIVERDTVPG